MQFNTTATVVANAATPTARTTTTTNTAAPGSAAYERTASNPPWAVGNRKIMRYITSLVLPSCRPLDQNIVASAGNDDQQDQCQKESETGYC